MTLPPRHPIRGRTLVLGLALLAAIVLLWRASAPESLDITFLDVGQGDAVLIEAPGDRTILVDGGSSATAEKVLSRGVARIDLLVASHPHADHIRGLEEVIEEFPVVAYLDNGIPHTSGIYQTLMAAIESRPTLTYLRPEARTIHLGDASVEILPNYPAAQQVNDASLALVVRYGEFSVLLTGDAEVPRLNHLVETGAVPNVTVLKASHHGADNGYTDVFLAESRPEVVVISVGARNAFGHPDEMALSAYYSTATDVYRTDLDGSITVRGFRDGTYRIVTER